VPVLLAQMLSDAFIMWLPKLVSAAFMFAFGGCVGSFLNVVVYRVPAGRSVVSPPSRCPMCGAMLAWYDNLPIVGWLLLRGRCRRCRNPISIEYPAIELLVAVLFAGTFLILFASTPSTFWGKVGGSWWRQLGFAGAWPAFAVLMAMISGLVGATLIDARTFLIPGGITTTMTLVAFGGWTLQAILPEPMRAPPNLLPHPLPGVGWTAICGVFGGGAGLVVANVLLLTGRLPRSFADYDDFVTDDEPLADYPHGRREMWKELLFLAPVVIGGVLGGVLGARMAPDTAIPALLSVLGASGLGFLVGGALVWGVRILGTLAFGREAMGMGDVHLLAAVGAALGWVDPIRVFFIAPFLALAWIAVSRLVASVRGRSGHELPYGPHLAMATLVVVYARPVIEQAQEFLLHPPASP
jgi:leader peptidase (prepilin peptidase)/N-methyltransferase